MARGCPALQESIAHVTSLGGAPPKLEAQIPLSAHHCCTPVKSEPAVLAIQEGPKHPLRPLALRGQ